MHGLVSAGHDFDPRQISDCRCWLRSDKGILLNSNKVATWSNQVSGVSADASNSNDGQRPTYAAGANGLPKISFSGTQWFFPWALALSGPKTIAIVFKLTSAPGTGFSVYDFSAGGNDSELLVDLSGYQPVSFIDDYVSGAATMVGHNDALGTSLVRGLFHTYNGGTNTSTGSYTATLDGASRTMAGSAAYGFVLTPGALGARGDGTFPLVGDMYEVIAYGRALTAQEQADLWGYLKRRYAL